MALETPATSVKFLQHFQKHLERVENLQQRLSKFSVLLLGAGLSVIAYGALSYMESRSLATSPKGKLGSAIDQTDMSTAINGISMVIWSLVAAKAKQGYDASGSKDTQTVGSALERVGSLILMIVVAGGLNIYSQMESQQQVMIKPKVSMP